MNRATKVALALASLTLLCTLGVCGVALVLGPQLADVAGCREGPPEVSGVQEDTQRVREALPGLGEITEARWRWREARPRTCPEIGPMDYYYEGFATLAPARAGELRTQSGWEAGAAPGVPPELAPFAPRAPAWRRSAAFDAAASAAVWFDPGTGTVYFSYLRG